MPSIVSTLQSDRPENPLQPTSEGFSPPVSFPALLHKLLVLGVLCFIGLLHVLFPVSARMISRLVECEVITVSGQSCVDVMLAGNFSRLPRSTSSSSQWWWRRQGVALGCAHSFSPALKNVVVLGFWWYLMVVMAVVMLSATAVRTWLWRQRVHPSPVGNCSGYHPGSPSLDKSDQRMTQFCSRHGCLQNFVGHHKQPGSKT